MVYASFDVGSGQAVYDIQTREHVNPLIACTSDIIDISLSDALCETRVSPALSTKSVDREKRQLHRPTACGRKAAGTT